MEAEEIINQTQAPEEILQPVIPPAEAVEELLGSVGIDLGSESGELDALLTAEQIQELSQLTNNNNELLLNIDNRAFIYEVLALIHSNSYEKAIQYLRTARDKSLEQFYWGFPTLVPARDEMLRDAEIYRERQVIAKGIYVCRQCKSSETRSQESMNRRADEQVRVHVLCNNCGNAWFEG